MNKNARLLTIAAALATLPGSVLAAQTMPSRTPVSYTSKATVQKGGGDHDVRHAQSSKDEGRGQHNDDRSRSVSASKQADSKPGHRNDPPSHSAHNSSNKPVSGLTSVGWSKPQEQSSRHSESSGRRDSWDRHDSRPSQHGRNDDLELSKVRRGDPEATFWKDLGQDPWGSGGRSSWKQVGVQQGHSVWSIAGSERGVTYYKVYDNNADQKFWNSRTANMDDQTLWRLRESDGGRGVLVLRDNDRGITLYKVTDQNKRDNPVFGNNGFRVVNWSKVDDDDGRGHGGKPGRGNNHGHGNGHNGHGHGHHQPRPPVSGC